MCDENLLGIMVVLIGCALVGCKRAIDIGAVLRRVTYEHF
jgi:hypothetical protein